MVSSTLSDLARQSLAALRLLVVFTVILGVGYPVAVWAVGRAFGDRADGQPVRVDGQVVGSALIGQSFTGAEWFHPRPSANDYDPLASAPSNLGPLSPDLDAAIAERRTAIAASRGRRRVRRAGRCRDLLRLGLDPHISPAYAELQAARVADANGLSLDQVRRLIDDHTQGRFLGFHGEPGVNLLMLNVAILEART